jgi:hypothetical protein
MSKHLADLDQRRAFAQQLGGKRYRQSKSRFGW